MQDIRLVGNDGEYLNLETQTGDKFRLLVDDGLRAAIRRDSSIQLDSLTISPREIQDAIRAGATAEEVSEKHSVPLDYVEKFALTVVDEISHIIASAKAVRLSIAQDRYSEATQVEFGDVVSERIQTQGGVNVEWSATKFEGLPWHVTASYLKDGKETRAIWSFDQRKLVLSPENESALSFSASDHASSTPIPKIRQVSSEVTQVIDLPIAKEPAPSEEKPELAPVSSIEALTRSSVESAVALSLVDISEAAAIDEDDDVDDSKAEQPLTATADLLEALRRKKADHSKAESSQVKSVDDTLEPVEEVNPAPVASPKKGRPSMPSWDEIVFGTKTDD